MTQYCPNCGGQLSTDSLDRPGLRRVPDDGGRVARYPFGDAAATGATWQEYRRPARPPNVAADVVVPFLQAAGSAVAAAAVAVLPVTALDISWAAIPTAAGLAFAGAWLYLLRDGRAALWEVERLERAEPAAEPAAVATEPARPATRLSVSIEGGRVQHERELPIEPDDLIRLARALSGGRVFSERELTAAGLLSGRAQYEAVRSVFLAVGWVRWKSADRRQGLEITPAGRGGLAALADGRVTVEAVAAAAA